MLVELLTRVEVELLGHSGRLDGGLDVFHFEPLQKVEGSGGRGVVQNHPHFANEGSVLVEVELEDLPDVLEFLVADLTHPRVAPFDLQTSHRHVRTGQQEEHLEVGV